MPAKNHQYRNLVFAGGGFRGVAHVAAVLEFSKVYNLSKIERVAGTSVGAMIACFLAVGYTPEDIVLLMKELDYSKILEGENAWAATKMYYCRKYLGVSTGNYLLDFIEKKIFEKLGVRNISYYELHERRMAELQKGGSKLKDLYTIGYNSERKACEIFSHEIPDYSPDPIHPFCPISLGTFISAAYPFYIRPIEVLIPAYDQKSNEYIDIICKYSDGGSGLNYAIHLFDKQRYLDKNLSKEAGEEAIFNTQTLGFRLDSHSEIVKLLKSKDKATEEQKNAYQRYIEKKRKALFEKDNYTQEDIKATKELLSPVYCNSVPGLRVSEVHPIRDCWDFLGAQLSPITLSESERLFRNNPDEVKRAIFSNTQNIESIERNLTEAQEELLWEAGVNGFKGFCAYQNHLKKRDPSVHHRDTSLLFDFMRQETVKRQNSTSNLTEPLISAEIENKKDKKIEKSYSSCIIL